MVERADLAREHLTVLAVLFALVAGGTGCSEKSPVGTADSGGAQGDAPGSRDSTSPDGGGADIYLFPDTRGDAADAAEPGDTTHSTNDTGSKPIDAAAACGPVEGKADDTYLEVLGDADNRPPCNDVCGDVCLVCDGNYNHPDFALIAYTAEYGPPESSFRTASARCDERPSATESDFEGNEKNLRTYTCYCRLEN